MREGVAPAWMDAAEGCDPQGHEPDSVGETYRRLRSEHPDLDVRVVDAGNTLWLVPTVYRAGRARGLGRSLALASALRANRPGAVLVDGVTVGDVDHVGPAQIHAAVAGLAQREVPRYS